MTVIRSAEYRRACRRILRWAHVYTRGIASDVADERLDQLASDLHDQAVWADDAGLDPVEAAQAVTRRSLQGVVDDLSWRRDQVHRAKTSSTRAHSSRGDVLVVTAVLTMGLAMTSAGGYAFFRGALYALRQHDDAIAAPLAVLAISLLIAAAGMFLLSRPRARFFASCALVISAACMVQGAFGTLLYSSGVVNQTMFLSPLWPLPKYVLIGALMLYFAATSLWWLPGLARSTTTEEAR